MDKTKGMKDARMRAISIAKVCGLWQKFSPREKEDIVRYFYVLGNALPIRQKALF